jgi:type VI secretion system secreted protein VgrG
VTALNQLPEKSMATYTQADRSMSVSTPLGKDVLLLVGFTGHEAISQLFSFDIDVIAENSKDVAFDKLLGQKVTITLNLAGNKKRFFNGICNRVIQGGRDDIFTTYQLQIVPQLWLLSQKAQSRIFQQTSVPDILKKVFDGLDVAFELGKYEPRDYCVQYRETDFHFASRLMEEEGIYYYFKHTADGHKMLVADTPQSHADLPERSRVLFIGNKSGPDETERIFDWSKVQEVRSGKYVLWDHDFELPHKSLEAEKTIQSSVQVGKVTHKLDVANNSKLELYDFPGEYAQRFDGVSKGGGEQPKELDKVFDDNKRTVGIRMQEQTVPGLVINGGSDCERLVSGFKFSLEGHFNSDGQYVLTSVSHTASGVDYRSGGGGDCSYSNTFTCIPIALPFRPARTTPKPVVPGTQTALVVGPKGSEIFTDKYGRVKVQFFWDRQGKKDADSSCWVRVAQVWAGKRWGAYFVPRIGQEVVVAFEEGDPDEPIIVGSVYNAEQMHPYLGKGLDSKHQEDPKLSGIKTNTTPDGKGFNELRFDDTKDKEQVFIHGEKDMDVKIKNDSREKIIHDRHLIVGAEKDGKKSGDQKEKVFQDKHLHVLRDQQEKIEGNAYLTIGKGDAQNGGTQHIAIEKDKFETIGKTDQLHVGTDQVVSVDGQQSLTVTKDKKELLKAKSNLHVMGDRMEKVDGGQSLTVGGDQQEKVGQKHALDAGQEIHLKAGMKMILEAGTQLSLKVGGNFVDISSAGVTIFGTMVQINSGGAAGSGSGSSPAAPTDATGPTDATEAKPVDPAEADDSVSGQKSAPS